jgi:hypothetical protein
VKECTVQRNAYMQRLILRCEDFVISSTTNNMTAVNMKGRKGDKEGRVSMALEGDSRRDPGE